jgi:hypothetical protein
MQSGAGAPRGSSLLLPRRLAVLESLGFAVIVAIIWADELLDLPHHLFGAAATPLRASEALFESAAVALLGAVVVTLSVRMARRVAYFESLVVLCSWCHRVRHAGQWTTLETFFAGKQAATSHGICPECAQNLDATAP